MLGKYIYDINQKRRVENDLPWELLKNGLLYRIQFLRIIVFFYILNALNEGDFSRT